MRDADRAHYKVVRIPDTLVITTMWWRSRETMRDTLARYLFILKNAESPKPNMYQNLRTSE